MKTTRDKDLIARQNAALLDACKGRLDMQSDYALAKQMGIAHQHIIHWRNGRGLNNRALYWIAQTLESDPRDMIAGYELEHAEGAERDFWIGYLARAADLAKSVAKNAGKGLAIVALLIATAGFQATSTAIDAARRMRYRA